MRLARRSLVVVAAAAVLAPGTAASRTPTRVERGAIVFAVQTFPSVSRTLRIRFTQIRVATTDRRFASARTDVRDAQGSRVGFFEWLLRRSAHGLWHVTWYGTKPPPCRAAPAAVRRDVLGSAACAP